MSRAVIVSSYRAREVRERQKKGRVVGERSRARSLSCFSLVSVGDICFSASCHLFQLFGVTSALHSDLRGGEVDLTKIVGREVKDDRSDILVQTMQLRGARNGNDPRLLGEQPGERDLGWSRLFPLANFREQIDQGLVRLQRLGCETSPSELMGWMPPPAGIV